MPAPIAFEVDTSGLSRQVNRFSVYANISIGDAWTRALRRLARYMQAITPPGQGGGKGEGAIGLDSADKTRGENAIDRDLKNLFYGVRRRFSVTDPDPIHRRLFAQKIPGKKLRRDRPAPYPVDEVKLARLARFLKARVGKTAAQWNPGFDQLGIRPVAWVARQGDGAAKGSARRRDTFLSFEFQMSANSIPDQFAGEVDRRSRYALQYTEASLGREIDAIFAKGDSRAAA